jgi:serine/threonine protein kinase
MTLSLHGNNISSLKEYYKGRIDHNVVISLTQQVLQTLRKVHQHGFVHSDIKPQNILFNSKFVSTGISNIKNGIQELVLVDFGISEMYIDQTGAHISKEKVSKFRGSQEFTAADCLELYSKSYLSHHFPSILIV